MPARHAKRVIAMMADDPTRAAITEAATWMHATGWPTRSKDLTLAARVLTRAGKLTSPNLMAELMRALARTGDEESVVHRAVLCRMTIRLWLATPPARHRS